MTYILLILASLMLESGTNDCCSGICVQWTARALANETKQTLGLPRSNLQTHTEAPRQQFPRGKQDDDSNCLLLTMRSNWNNSKADTFAVAPAGGTVRSLCRHPHTSLQISISSARPMQRWCMKAPCPVPTIESACLPFDPCHRLVLFVSYKVSSG